MLHINQVERGIVNYLDAEVFSKLPSGGQYDELKRLGAAAMAVYVVRHGRAALEKLMENPFLGAIGATNSQNEVDIDGLKEVVMDMMPDKGITVTIPLLPEITLYKSDVDKLYQYIIKS